jgi:hypothetical protein
MEVTLELVHILGDDGVISRVELASTTVVFKGAFALTRKVLFDIHDERVDEEWRMDEAR